MIKYGMFEIGEGSGKQKMNTKDAIVPIPIKNVSCEDWKSRSWSWQGQKSQEACSCEIPEVPLGVRKPQLMEPEDEAADYLKVYQCLETQN